MLQIIFLTSFYSSNLCCILSSDFLNSTTIILYLLIYPLTIRVTIRNTMTLCLCSFVFGHYKYVVALVVHHTDFAQSLSLSNSKMIIFRPKKQETFVKIVTCLYFYYFFLNIWLPFHEKRKYCAEHLKYRSSYYYTKSIKCGKNRKTGQNHL